MKKLYTLLFLCATLGIKAQSVPATYAADFKAVWAAATKYYKTDKTGECTNLSGSTFKQECPCKSSFQNALESKLVVDRDDVLNHHVVFDAGKTKEEALKTLRKFIDATKPLLPAKFVESNTTDLGYADQKAYKVEYGSELFAEVAKKPSLVFGVKEKDGKFVVDILVMAPVFTFD
ncbi:MAG TPA: hypothetical protein VK177_17675, partial [Flavobacteriales bacterium]|nr:hypothetical protein [Flavobacteriales bacterium]